MKKKIVLTVVFALLIVALIYKFLPAICYRSHIDDDIRAYALEHKQMTLGEATDFDWDVAYIDLSGDMRAKLIVKDFALEIKPKARPELKLLKGCCRLLFLKDGEIAEDLIYSINDLNFMVLFEDRQVYPDTVFNVVDYYSEKLHKNNICLVPDQPKATDNPQNEMG
ncbi:MAG: hypothetical protein K5756_09200 [Clostridiales bacterium]|nr:hypothetical protein [Clostridiales bacterium]